MNGQIVVNPRGGLTLANSQVQGGVVANGSAFVSVCGSEVNGPASR
ncbi:MAG: hypothetical protein ACRD12_10685 [Acidimicrobiales bacterium]